jgi:hypothetical protein
MRHLLAAGLVIALSQQAPAVPQVAQQDIWVIVAYSQVAGGSASVRVMRNEIYVDNGPTAGVGMPVPNGERSELMFTVRGWKEGEKARVVVSARLDDKRAPGGATETPIATFTIAATESIEVRETQKWGAPPLRVTAVLR